MSSLQRKMNRRHLSRKPQSHVYGDKFHRTVTSGLSREQTNKPDKGKRDGSCNRTACQKPLAGMPRWSMDYGSGRLYYCTECTRDFRNWDRKIGDRLRCEIIDADQEWTREVETDEFVGPIGTIFADNDMEPDERREIYESLAERGFYRDGGGAAAEFAIYAVWG